MSKNTLIDLIHIFLKLKRKNKRRPNGETIAGDAKGACTLTLIASRQTWPCGEGRFKGDKIERDTHT